MVPTPGVESRKILPLKFLDQLATNRKPQPVAFDSRMLIAGKSEEGLENLVERFRRYAWPVVADDDAPVVDSGQALNPYIPGCGSILDCIGHEVAKDLLTEGGIRDDL